MPVDVIYPLASGSRASTLDDAEIRYSLRSLAKHARNIGKVFVVGSKPDLAWSDSLVHIPFEESKYRYLNAWNKLNLVANHEEISEKFLWMNDDFYILRDFDAGNVPYYCRSLDLATMPLARLNVAEIKSQYQQTLRYTLDALRKRRCATMHFGTHQPVNYEKRRVREVIEEFTPDLETSYRLAFRVIYCNWFKVERIQRSAVMIRKKVKNPEGRFTMSSRADITAEVLHESLKHLFPMPSRYELIESQSVSV